MTKIIFEQNDCLNALRNQPTDFYDLIYLDPPFFTQQMQKLKSRDGLKEFSFSDLWKSHEEYTYFLYERLVEIKRVLSPTGSLFFHCDKNASHIIRLLLDSVMGGDNFQAEIIWTYKRWSHSKKGLLPAHQTIFFYSKTSEFKFNRIFVDYSPTTNLDQITQKRARDDRGKAIYATDEEGGIILNGSKMGVPLSDVWDIPYLNPKAKERVGYPTQKPVILLEKIINICTDENDWILDPFCGSGTTLVAAILNGRNALGIDISEQAINVAKQRIENPIKSESLLLKNGKESYLNSYSDLGLYLKGLDYVPVQRNNGIDAMLKNGGDEAPVFIRIQRKTETIMTAATLLQKAMSKKGKAISLLVVTNKDDVTELSEINKIFSSILFIDAVSEAIKAAITKRLPEVNYLSNKKQQNVDTYATCP